MDDSIKQYLEQLTQVEAALKVCSSEEEKKSLESLRDDLHELVQLTQETSNGTSEKDQLDDEMSIFMSEINKLEGGDTEKEETESPSDTTNDICGTKCSAPHTHTWGGVSYHNALIFKDDRKESATVRVIFTNPTHDEMIPCPSYFDGHCRFEDDCRLSHGEVVDHADLKKYREPDFNMLNKVKKCLVLVKLDDDLWHKGIVTSVDFKRMKCGVELLNKRFETVANFESVFPIDEIRDSDGEQENELSDEENYKKHRDKLIIDRTLMADAPTGRLGQWEEHTRGMGSKLMQKMGYIVGSGLGKLGEGIVTPVTSQLLPPRSSLDYCMSLREEANGDENFFNVERQLKIRMSKKHKNHWAPPKKASALDKKPAARPANRNVFDFINNQIFNETLPVASSSSTPNTSQHSTATAATSTSKAKPSNFKSHTVKNLNIAGFEISENIRKKQKEIEALSKSLSRHKTGSEIHSNMLLKLKAHNSELKHLQDSERCVMTEQKHRNNKTKLNVF